MEFADCFRIRTRRHRSFPWRYRCDTVSTGLISSAIHFLVCILPWYVQLMIYLYYAADHQGCRKISSEPSTTTACMWHAVCFGAIRIPLGKNVWQSSRRYTNRNYSECYALVGLVNQVIQSTDPHVQYIIYAVLLHHGLKHHKFLRSQKHWQKMFPFVMDHVLVDVDSDLADTYAGGRFTGLHTPIEVQLRSLAVTILYEVCRVQKMTVAELSMWICQSSNGTLLTIQQRFSVMDFLIVFLTWSNRQKKCRTRLSTTRASNLSCVLEPIYDHFTHWIVRRLSTSNSWLLRFQATLLPEYIILRIKIAYSGS